MSYTIVPIAKNDSTAAFSLYKTSLFEFIDQAFGWDEIFQQDRFAASYPVNTLQWIVMDGVVKGLWCVSDKNAELHLHLVLLYPKQQGIGVGKLLLADLHEQAKAKNKSVSLSCFKSNTRALRFYEKLGYQVVGDDEHFFDLLYSTTSSYRNCLS